MLSEFIKKRKIGQILMDMGFITEEQLFMALEKQKESKQLIGRILIEEEFVDEDGLAMALARQFDVDYINLANFVVDEEVVERITPTLIQMYQFIPYIIDGNELTIVTHDPTNLSMFDDIRVGTSFDVNYVVGARDKIEKFVQDRFAKESEQGLDKVSTDDILEDVGLEFVSDEDDQGDAEDLKKQSDQKPIIMLVNKIFLTALADGCSDIHIEGGPKVVQVRFRMDGVLYDKMAIPAKAHNAIISRVKIMAELDIAERRIPQDGAISLKYSGMKIDFRISILPSIHGENVVIRVLRKDKVKLDIRALGFEGRNLAVFERAIAKPYGMVLTTGPTGSGKTTTLYSALTEVYSREIKIITVENPVEYQLPGIHQTQTFVNKNDPEKSLTFASGLRSILRQDPDIVMIGEIRDEETAEISVAAALTGHLVFSTLHTNNAVDVVARMSNMAIDVDMLSSALNLVMAQRLVRRLCSDCKIETKPEKLPVELCGITEEELMKHKFYGPKGCPECDQRGYKGRVGCYEVMDCTPQLRQMIYDKASSMELLAQAVKEGMETLIMAGKAKAIQAVTSVKEAAELSAN